MAATKEKDATSNIVPRLNDAVRLTFITFAEQIAQHAKIGDLWKMIQQCKELTADNASQQKAWDMISRVRQDVLGTPPPKDTAPPDKQPNSHRKQADAE